MSTAINNEDLKQGLLVLGMSNTVYFGQGALHELVFVDLASGQDFSMQISEEQAGFLVNMLGGSEEQATEESSNAAEKSAFEATEATPQL